MILNGFELHFDTFWDPDAVQASPAALWGPLGRHGGPSSCSGSEKLVRWIPSGLPKWGHFGSFLCIFSLENASNKNIDFLMILGLILNGFWINFECFLGCFFVDFFYPIFTAILYGFWELSEGSTWIFAIPSMRKHVFFKFGLIRNLFKNDANNDQNINKQWCQNQSKIN